MPKSFDFVQEFGGVWIDFTQDAIRPSWEKQMAKHPKQMPQKFTGACMGMNLGLIQSLLVPQSGHDKAFKQLGRVFHLPSPDKCLRFQNNYELAPKNYENRLVRAVLNQKKINLPFPEEKTVGESNLLNFIRENDDDGKNLVFVFNIDFDFVTQNERLIQTHAISLVKLDGFYFFFEPTYGIAIFNNPKPFYDWLLKETDQGQLKYLVKPVKEKIIIDTNQMVLHAQIKEGEKRCTRMKCSDYSFYLPLDKDLNLPKARY